MLTPQEFITILSRLAIDADPKADVTGLQLETRFTHLGLDSLATMELIGLFERELGVLVPESRLMNLRTVGELHAALNSAIDERA